MKHNQDGFGFISMLLALVLVGVIAWFIYGNYFNDETSIQESSQELINDAQDTVEKANDTKQQAEELIELAN